MELRFACVTWHVVTCANDNHHPMLFWQHCVHRVLLLTLPATTGWLHRTGRCFTYVLQHRGWITLNFSSLQVFYFRLLPIYKPWGSSLLFSMLPSHISNIRGHSPGMVTGIPLGLSHARQNLRQPCYSELITCTKKIFHKTKPWSEVQEGNSFES